MMTEVKTYSYTIDLLDGVFRYLLQEEALLMSVGLKINRFIIYGIPAIASTQVLP